MFTVSTHSQPRLGVPACGTGLGDQWGLTEVRFDPRDLPPVHRWELASPSCSRRSFFSSIFFPLTFIKKKRAKCNKIFKSLTQINTITWRKLSRLPRMRTGAQVSRWSDLTGAKWEGWGSVKPPVKNLSPSQSLDDKIKCILNGILGQKKSIRGQLRKLNEVICSVSISQLI